MISASGAKNMRYYCHRKATAEESCRLRISKLRKDGLLSDQATGKMSWTSSMTGKETTIIVGVNLADTPFVVLVYSLKDRDGNKTDYSYHVLLVTTPCNFGGVRYWFLAAHTAVGV